ncbi:MAG TPA: glycosyltransferase family 39 protein [Anaerolineaceae bacterium]|jgi:hypothetical protein
MDEPTVLDYLKAKLAFWRHADLQIPDQESPAASVVAPEDTPRPLEYSTVQESLAEPAVGVAGLDGAPPAVRETLVERAPVRRAGPMPVYEPAPLPEPEEEIPEQRGPFPWRMILAVIVALVAQRTLNPPIQQDTTGAVLYSLAAVLILWGWQVGDFRLNPTRPEETRTVRPIRWEGFVVGVPMALLSFFIFGNGLFTPATLTAWLVTLAAFCYAFWAPVGEPLAKRAWAFIRQPRWRVVITPWMILVLVVALVGIFFRVYQLNSVPAEMVSDHAEKLLDVSDVLNGRTAVFFPRNTGREFFQFYLTAAVILLFKTGLSFLSLKIGTTFMGLITLPYIYMLGKEIGNKRVALAALAFAAIAYWPNVITRVALRFTLYPAFVAPMLYYLIRGLRRSNRNDFIYAGIALGLGLNGYSSYRIVPFLVVVAFALYLLHRREQGDRKRALIGLGIVALVSFVIFIPLLRYTIDAPQDVLGRTLTRISTTETPLPGPAWKIFLGNLWNASTMFFWSDGTTWVHSVPLRPALETVTAALFFIGLVLVGIRYWKRRNWVDLLLLVSIPILLMPSILSLAFPDENPSLNRTGGAIIPVFIMVGVALDEVFTSLRGRLPGRIGSMTGWAVVLVLMSWSMWGNFDLVFNQYATQYRNSANNTSEIGHVIRGFADSVGTGDSAYVVAYPYWVDTRLVGINAGYPTKDYAINIDQLADTRKDPHTKLFILNIQDQKAIETLRGLYPQGALSTYTSMVPTKDFLLYQVPPGEPTAP